MNLTPEQADKLGKAWSAIHEAYNALEDLRPGGGFRERIDPKYCKECGRPKEGQVRFLELHRQRVEEIRQRVKKLRPDWYYEDIQRCLQPHHVMHKTEGGCECVCNGTFNSNEARNEMIFVAHARQDVPWLIAEIERLMEAQCRR